MTHALAPAVEWLAAHTPQQVNSRLVSSAHSLGVKLQEVTELKPRYSPAGAFLGNDLVRHGAWEAIGEGAATALAKVEATMIPTPDRQVEAWLAELSLITARRADTPEADELRLVAYANRLAEYPADVVRGAVLGRTWHFWPTWAELQAECEKLIAPRRAMIAALKREAEKAAERKRRASALPTAEMAVETPQEAAQRRARGTRLVADILADMKAKVQAEEAAAAAARAAAYPVNTQRMEAAE